MRGGLSGEHLQLFTDAGASKVSWTASSSNPPAMTWLQSTFDTPVGVATGSQKLLFNATGLNRGRVWVNGHDAGRFVFVRALAAVETAERFVAVQTGTSSMPVTMVPHALVLNPHQLQPAPARTLPCTTTRLRECRVLLAVVCLL